MGLTAGILLVVVLLMNVGLEDVAATLGRAVPVYLLLGALAYALFFVLRGIRWKFILHRAAPATSVTTTSSLSAFGWLVSTFVPMKAGDLARATMLARRERTAFAAVMGSVAVERMLDVLGLAVIASLALLGAAVFAHAHLDPFVGDAVAIAWILPLLGFALLLALAGALRRHRERNALLRLAGRFLDAIEELRRAPRRIPALVGLSLLVTAAQVAIFVALFLAFQPGAFVPLVAAGVPIFLLSFAVPLVPGHVGTYELAFIVVFASLGFDAEVLQPMSLAVHLMTMSFVTVLGGTGFVVDRLTREDAAPDRRGMQASP